MIETLAKKDLQAYRGKREVPEDFNDFWNSNLQEIKESIPYQLKEKDFGLSFVKCFELTFEASGKGRVYAKCLFPNVNEPVPVIFVFHGYQGQSPDWTENLKYIAAGYAVVCMDVPGQAGHSVDSGQYKGITVKGQVIRGVSEGREHLFYKHVYLDIYRLISIVSSLSMVDEDMLYSLGASQGGALALVAAALHPSIKKTVTVYPFLSDFERVLELGNHSEAYDELFRYFKFTDPFHLMEEKIFQILSYIDVKNMAQRIKNPVLMVTGMDDDVCPPSTQYAIFNRLEGQKHHYVLPEYGHEALNVGVNDLIYDFLIGSTIMSSEKES